LLSVWIDILTPKQVLFFFRLINELKKDGVPVLVTTRRYREANELMKIKGVRGLVVGRHGGRTLLGKLLASAQRVEKLARLVSKRDIKVAVSFCSPEAARVAFGLAIPHIAICDAPHSTAVGLLTIPLSAVLVTPSFIPLDEWIKLGAVKDKIVTYRAIDPVAWLKEFSPNERVLKELHLSRSDKIVVARTLEVQASYALNFGEDEFSPIEKVVNAILDLDEEARIVVLQRYGRRSKKPRGNRRIIIPKRAVDGASLLYYSILFVGAGGTMTWEAALLGIPAISLHPRVPSVEVPLIQKGLLYHPRTDEEAIQIAAQILNKPSYYLRQHRKKAEKVMEEMEDPIKVIKEVVYDFLNEN